MEITSKKTWFGLFILFSLAVLPLQAFHPAPPAMVAVATCTPPSPSVTSQSSGSVSFAWGGVLGASGYRVWYHRREDNYTSSQVPTTNTYISFSSLPAGTYTFYFVTDCGSNDLSQPAIIDDFIII